MASLVPSADTPHSPNARLARRTGRSSNSMGLAFHCQYDGIGHWSNYTETESCVECKRDTNTHCIKCGTPPCTKYNGENNCIINCFYHFHNTPKDTTIKTPKFLNQDSEESDCEPCTVFTSH